MFIIGEAVIEDQVAREHFACDLNACKGACCTLPGGRGAPLRDEEVDEIRKAYPRVKHFLDERHRRAAGHSGCVEGAPGSYATTCLDDRDCVFVFYEEGVARCAIERGYYEGLIPWQKPLSCHLFPIRLDSDGRTRVRYEKISQCESAPPNGRNLNMPLYVFLKSALVRAFGEEWYSAFSAECRRRSGASAPP